MKLKITRNAHGANLSNDKRHVTHKLVAPMLWVSETWALHRYVEGGCLVYVGSFASPEEARDHAEKETTQ